MYDVSIHMRSSKSGDPIWRSRVLRPWGGFKELFFWLFCIQEFFKWSSRKKHSVHHFIGKWSFGGSKQTLDPATWTVLPIFESDRFRPYLSKNISNLPMIDDWVEIAKNNLKFDEKLQSNAGEMMSGKHNVAQKERISPFPAVEVLLSSHASLVSTEKLFIP